MNNVIKQKILEDNIQKSKTDLETIENFIILYEFKVNNNFLNKEFYKKRLKYLKTFKKNLQSK